MENELAIRLLQRTSRGVTPTSAGLAFYSRRHSWRCAMPMMPSSPPARRACQATLASAWPPAPPPFSASRSSMRCAKAIPTCACIWWKASPVIWSG
ncbi:hypothetical protein LNP17_08975 [Klebsiella variicola subsp. variicola]|nr:hypothetical protein [Klebsiella variicola subsp. variicola]